MGYVNHQGESNSLMTEPKGASCSPSTATLACMINSEIGAVLAVMRRNVRWGVHYGMDDDQFEHTLIYSFQKLRKDIFPWHQQHNLDPVVYLQPFLDVIQSDETGAPITGVALSSVDKMLTLDVINVDSSNVSNPLHLIVDAVTSCRFEVTDPASEEVVLMKILQVLLACMKNKASVALSNHHVCNIVNTCFRIVHQASSKGELLQRIARHTMHELIRCIFSHLPNIEEKQCALSQGSTYHNTTEIAVQDESHNPQGQEDGKENSHAELGNEASFNEVTTAVISDSNVNEKTIKIGRVKDNEEDSMTYPYGIPCMVEIFHFLCSLLNVMEHIESGPTSNPIAYDEDIPLFALGLINSAIELGGGSFERHPELLSILQGDLFQYLMRFGLSISPLILSTVCSIVLNLYHHLRSKLKLQIEAFISGVLLRVAQSKHEASYQQKEVALEALVDFCRQHTFMTEMFANFDCDISHSNVFEDITNLLSKSTFPVNSPLSVINTVALDGLIAMIHGMAERVGHDLSVPEQISLDLQEYYPFWTVKCSDYRNFCEWIPFVHKMKLIKKKLAIGVDHLNRDLKKGLEYLQGIHLLPQKLDPQSVACLLRYTAGLDKTLIGDFLGSHDEFSIEVLHEFAKTFDFSDMNLDTALRIFLETFKLPGESQKIQRVLEAFAGRYYEESPNILANEDAALVLSYSLILLNTDQHNSQVKKKMTEEDFIRNNRRINGGNDLPRELLTELYHSICENEIRMTPDQGAGVSVVTPGHWIGLVHRSKQTAPFITSGYGSYLDYDMFAVLSGPTIAAIAVVFGHVEHDYVLLACLEGLLAIAKVSASYNFDDVLDDLVVSLCKFTTLLSPTICEEFVLAFGDDAKAKMATEAVFTMANLYGDHIRSGWKNILDCILSMQKLGLLPARLATDAANDLDSSPDQDSGRNATSSSSATRVLTASHSRKSSGLMGMFSQLLYYDTEEPILEPTEEDVAARRRALQAIHNCHIDSIFTDSKFLQADSLLQLVQALVVAAARPRKGINSFEDEESAVFCLELLIVITLNNRDRITLLWQCVYEHISNVVQSTTIPCTLVEKAIFGLLCICQRLLPYKETLTDELLKSLQLVLKHDARVADAYCEHITQEVMNLVKVNAMQIRSHKGWLTIISLLSITARHPEASEAGFETLSFIMSDGLHLLPANYVFCVNAARQFAESKVGNDDRSVKSLDLMAGSLVCLNRWFHQTKEVVGEEVAVKMSQDIWEMWLRLVQGLRKVCLDLREEVRNHAILMLQRSLTGVEGIHIPNDLWLQCFDSVIFTLLDDLLEVAERNTPKENRNMEGTFVLSLNLLSKTLIEALQDLFQLPSFCKLWLKSLSCMERCMKLKFRGEKIEKIHELVCELLKNILLFMKTNGILVPNDTVGEDSFWQLTWLHVKNISSSLQVEVFPSDELEELQKKHIQAGCSPLTDGSVLASPRVTTA